MLSPNTALQTVPTSGHLLAESEAKTGLGYLYGWSDGDRWKIYPRPLPLKIKGLHSPLDLISPLPYTHTLHPGIGNLLRHKREAVTWLSPVWICHRLFELCQARKSIQRLHDEREKLETWFYPLTEAGNRQLLVNAVISGCCDHLLSSLEENISENKTFLHLHCAEHCWTFVVFKLTNKINAHT